MVIQIIFTIKMQIQVDIVGQGRVSCPVLVTIDATREHYSVWSRLIYIKLLQIRQTAVSSLDSHT